MNEPLSLESNYSWEEGMTVAIKGAKVCFTITEDQVVDSRSEEFENHFHATTEQAAALRDWLHHCLKDGLLVIRRQNGWFVSGGDLWNEVMRSGATDAMQRHFGILDEAARKGSEP